MFQLHAGDVRSDLDAGFFAPASWHATNAASDSDADATLSGRSQPFALAAGDNRSDIDGGMYQPASIGNFVWQDTNGNGLHDAGGPGLPGVSVTLVSGSGTTLSTTTTDANGNYRFAGLAPLVPTSCGLWLRATCCPRRCGSVPIASTATLTRPLRNLGSSLRTKASSSTRSMPGFSTPPVVWLWPTSQLQLSLVVGNSGSMTLFCRGGAIGQPLHVILGTEGDTQGNPLATMLVDYSIASAAGGTVSS